MKLFALFLTLCLARGITNGQEAVYVHAGDSLKIRSDLYLRDYNLPFIILCPQEGSNRGDYNEIAPRLLNLNYNCLAIDLRSGGSAPDAMVDLKAAILYVKRFNDKPVILFGSSRSASLCLLAAIENPGVQAVVAFSPGEYFLPRINMAEKIRGIGVPLFVSGSQAEFSYLQKMTTGIPAGLVTLFKPEKGNGMQGIRALKEEGSAREEYWFALMMFFKKLK